MQCQADIQALSKSKLAESKCLFDNGFHDGAYYLAGYAVELLLKARVCKTLGIDDFFQFNKSKKKELYKAYKVHNYEELLLLSGIYTDFVNVQKDVNFKADWSIVRQWDEESRYITGRSPKDVEDFIESVNKIVSWIEGYL